MDKEEAEKVLATAAKVTAVDKSAPTIMCVVGLVEAISKQWGPDITALLCLPVLSPLMVAPSLSHQQFGMLTRCDYGWCALVVACVLCAYSVKIDCAADGFCMLCACSVKTDCAAKRLLLWQCTTGRGTRDAIKKIKKNKRKQRHLIGFCAPTHDVSGRCGNVSSALRTSGGVSWLSMRCWWRKRVAEPLEAAVRAAAMRLM